MWSELTQKRWNNRSLGHTKFCNQGPNQSLQMQSYIPSLSFLPDGLIDSNKVHTTLIVRFVMTRIPCDWSPIDQL